MTHSRFEEIFTAHAESRDAKAAADALSKRLKRAAHMGSLIKALPKLELDAALAEPARRALGDFVPQGPLDEFALVYGVAGLLAAEGSAASADALAAYGARARDATRGATVGDASELLSRVLAAVGKGPHVAKVTAALSAEVAARQSGSPAQVLVARIAPEVAKKPWSASVWIGTVGIGEPNIYFGAHQVGPYVHLTLDPQSNPSWRVALNAAPPARRSYSNWGGDVTQDDFTLEALTDLERFPAWLVEAGKKLDVTFSIDDAVVRTGRGRALAPLLKAWLGGAEAPPAQRSKKR